MFLAYKKKVNNIHQRLVKQAYSGMWKNINAFGFANLRTVGVI